jgi:hypothetical protein
MHNLTKDQPMPGIEHARLADRSRRRRTPISALRPLYDWAAKPLQRLCAIEPELADFALDAPPHTRHFIALALSGQRQAGLSDRALAEALPSTPRRELLRRIWGADLGSTRVLMRLADEPYEEATYRALAPVLASPQRRAAFSDLRRPTDRGILRLAEASKDVLCRFRGRLIGEFGTAGLLFLVDGLTRLRPDLGRACIERSLNALERPDRLDHLIMRLTRGLRLPPPPWGGTVTIKPLRTVAELRATGLRLENCLNGLIIWTEALSGQRVFYLAEERELCVVALARHSVFDTWFLHSLAKRRNGVPAIDVKRRIVEAFANAGFPYFDGAPIGTGLAGDM